MKDVKRSMLFLCLCMGLLSCGCQKTPEQVEENMSRYGDNPQVNESEITYCTVDELREMKMADISEGAVHFPKTVDFSRVEGVELLHLSVEKDFLSEDNIKKYAELFGVEREKFQEAESDEWGKTISYNNEKDRYMNISDNGGMAQAFGFSYDARENVVEKKYNMDEEDVSGVEVSLADGKVNLAQFCKDTEGWLEEHMPVDGMRYKVSDVYVRKEKKRAKDDPARVISLCAEYDYKGIRLNNHTMSLTEEDKEFNTKILTTFLAVMMDYQKQGLPCFFSRNDGFTVTSSEPVEKVVDLASAVRIVKEKLSGFGSIEITKILPLYALYVEEGEELPGAAIEARPVYAFLVEEEREPQRIGVVKTGNCHKFFYVDMITGELKISLEN